MRVRSPLSEKSISEFHQNFAESVKQPINNISTPLLKTAAATPSLSIKEKRDLKAEDKLERKRIICADND